MVGTVKPSEENHTWKTVLSVCYLLIMHLLRTITIKVRKLYHTWYKCVCVCVIDDTRLKHNKSLWLEVRHSVTWNKIISLQNPIYHILVFTTGNRNMKGNSPHLSWQWGCPANRGSAGVGTSDEGVRFSQYPAGVAWVPPVWPVPRRCVRHAYGRCQGWLKGKMAVDSGHYFWVEWSIWILWLLGSYCVVLLHSYVIPYLHLWLPEG